MAKHSMTISNVAIERIHAATTCNKLNEVKNLVYIATDCNDWSEFPSDGLFKYSAIEKTTGIVLKWNDYDPSNKSNLNGKLVCKVVGKWLKSQELSDQLILLFTLEASYSISQLDIKFQLNNPEASIEALHALMFECGLESYPSLAVKGFDSFRNEVSGKFNKTVRPHSIRLEKNSTRKKQLFIYDPIEKHGIENAQHWELRLRGTYARTAIKRLKSHKGDTKKISRIIVDMILDSMDIREGNRTMSFYKTIRGLKIVI